jgi:hypothetical protein
MEKPTQKDKAWDICYSQIRYWPMPMLIPTDQGLYVYIILADLSDVNVDMSKLTLGAIGD